MSDIHALLKDLQNELDKGTMIYRPHIESLIRKYSVVTTGDISGQSGEYQIRGGYVDAIQHAGTYESARAIREWISERGGSSEWLATDDQAIDTLHIRLSSPRQPNIVGPNWWVVKTADGIFFAVSETDFPIIYIPRKRRE